MVAAVGDVACDPGSPSYNGGLGTATECRHRSTSDLVAGAGLAGVLILGDIQYEDGTLAKFSQSYDPTWGRVKDSTYPAPGNHEYETAAAAGYYHYYGARAGDPSKGYYSFDLGARHLIALNSNCEEVGGCGAGSPQEQWLRADLRVGGRHARARSYVRFLVRGVTRHVTRAVLRLYVVDGGPAGGRLHATEDGWSERGLYWRRAPALGQALASVGPVRRGRWVELRLPRSAVPGSGRYSFALAGSGTDPVSYGSRESGYAPQLVLTIG